MNIESLWYCVIHFCIIQSTYPYITLTLQTNRRLHTLLTTRQKLSKKKTILRILFKENHLFRTLGAASGKMYMERVVRDPTMSSKAAAAFAELDHSGDGLLSLEAKKSRTLRVPDRIFVELSNFCLTFV